ncbi:MAG TPA: phosphotransferase family protein [Acidimicrobiales bacterium]|nr:phosphotransferase family protein [Acidimicrobiales bacterium]
MEGTGGPGGVEGIDAPRVTAWLEENVAGAQGPFEFVLIAGGRSNLTFRVTGADGTRYALRRPPVSHVLPTAHDMGREHRIISALGPTPVPVAPALGFCADETVNGRPFYVMGYVDGHIVRDRAQAESALDDHGRRTASEDLIDVLVAIHAVDVDAVGLGDLGRREGYIERQLRRWYGQFLSSIDGRDRKVPVVDEVHALLAARVPEQGRPALVHGDYRLDNTMLGPDGRVRAVLDWELCTLGDPLADLGLLNVYWAESQDQTVALAGVAATATPGFLSREEINRRFAARSGRDISELPFYVAFGYWKLACIVEGVAARYEGGAMGGDRGSGSESMGQQVESLAEMARHAVSQL